MAFMDKLGDIANKVGDFASDTFDAGKAQAKILSEKKKITDDYEALGKYVYETYKASGQLEQGQLNTFISDIDGHFEAIKKIEEEVEK